jgi:hypothetical protein
MYKISALVTALLAVIALTGVAFADDNLTPEGLFLGTHYSDGRPARDCYVAAYIYDITSLNPATHYGTAFTADFNYPPNFNICRFAREGASGDRYVIPCDSRYRWRFYAFKTINGTTYYSNWSKEMQYSAPDHLYDTDNLYLTRTSPPDPIPPYYAEE